MNCFRLLPVYCLAILFFTSPAAAGQDQESPLKEISAFLEISDRLATAGQVTYDQISGLKDAEFEVVVNLAPASEERNGREGFLVTEKEMTYVQIPVDWKNPSQRDLKLFFDVMEANRDRKVFVHCFANMRVSVFVYLYRTLVSGETEEEAERDLKQIWDPASQQQWVDFIARAREEFKR